MYRNKIKKGKGSGLTLSLRCQLPHLCNLQRIAFKSQFIEHSFMLIDQRTCVVWLVNFFFNCPDGSLVVLTWRLASQCCTWSISSPDRQTISAINMTARIKSASLYRRQAGKTWLKILGEKIAVGLSNLLHVRCDPIKIAKCWRL